MKRVIVILLVIALSVSLLVLGISCKEEAVEEAVEEVEEAAEEAVEEVEEAAEEAVEEETAEIDEVVEKLIVGTTANITSLDLQNARGDVGLAMQQLSYNGLVEYDKDGLVVPSIAEDWDISDDGLEYTFYIRKGIKFHNGRELTAEDVRWSYERYMMPEVGFPFGARFAPIQNMEVVDDYTIIITIDEPYGAFLAGLGSGLRGIVAKEAYTEDDVPEFKGEPIGTGPYKFVDWDPDNYYEIEAFEDYWAGEPDVKSIVFQVIPDTTTRVTALKTGSADLILMPSFTDIVAYNENPEEGYTLTTVPGTQSAVLQLAMDWTKPPFDDQRVRKAFQLAINPEDINKILFEELGTVATGLFPEGTYWYTDIEKPEQDFEEAKRLLAEAGYPDGLEVRVFAAEYAQVDKVSEILQAQLDNIGVVFNIEVLDFSSYLQAPRDWDYDCGINATRLWIDPDFIYRHVLSPDGPAHWWSGYAGTEETQELLVEAKRATDDDERKAIYKEVDQLFQDEGFIWLVSLPQSYGYRDGLEIDINVRGDWIYDNNHGLGWLSD